MSLRALAPGSGTQELRNRTGRRFDWWLLLSASILVFAGLLTLYSESILRDRGATFLKQVRYFAIGLVPFSIFAFVHPSVFRRFSSAIYVLNLLLLAMVLVMGKSLNGATRWVDIGPIQLQPSEIAKILLSVTVASFLANRENELMTFKTFALSGLHILVPALLIFKQPHFAATMVVVSIWLSACLVGGVPLRFMGVMLGVVVVFAVAAPFIPGVLKPYQRERWIGFLMGKKVAQSRDAKIGNKKASDVSYQTSRAAIAFGVGGVSGSGFLKGEQKQAKFVPYQSSDFIFTVVGEEGGLIGCSLVLAAFGFFFYRAWLVMVGAQEKFYQMMVAGMLAVLGLHMTVNLWMVLKLMPVAGLWLPFFSSGGSALWLCMSCVGLLFNIRSRERPILF